MKEQGRQIMRRLALLSSGVTPSIFASFEAVNLSNVLASLLATIFSLLARLLFGADISTEV